MTLRQLALQHALDLADDLRRGAVHQGDARRDVGLLGLGQARQHLGGGVGRQVGQDQRDGLRVLVGDDVEDLGGVGLAQELERAHLDGAGQARHDLLGVLGAERLLEDRAGVVEPALGDVLLGQRDLVELLDHLVLALGRDVADAGDLERELVDLLLAQVLEHGRRGLGAQAHEQDRGLLPPGQRRAHGRAPVPSSQPRSSCATSSGLRRARSSIWASICDLRWPSSCWTRPRSGGRHPGAELGDRHRTALEQLRQGLLEVGLAAAQRAPGEQGQQQHADRGDGRSWRCP